MCVCLYIESRESSHLLPSELQHSNFKLKDVNKSVTEEREGKTERASERTYDPA